jgi:hypothetical protein
MASQSQPGLMIRIRKPTAVFPPPEAAPTFRVDRPLKGLKVGIRHDGQWMSWELIAQVWKQKLADDGAEPVMMLTGEHTGEHGKDTAAELEAWAKSVDCAVVGIGT